MHWKSKWGRKNLTLKWREQFYITIVNIELSKIEVWVQKKVWCSLKTYKGALSHPCFRLYINFLILILKLLLYTSILESDIAKDDKSVESILHLQNIVSNSSSVTCKESSQQLNSQTDPTHLFYFKS